MAKGYLIAQVTVTDARAADADFILIEGAD